LTSFDYTQQSVHSPIGISKCFRELLDHKYGILLPSICTTTLLSITQCLGTRVLSTYELSSSIVTQATITVVYIIQGSILSPLGRGSEGWLPPVLSAYMPHM